MTNLLHWRLQASAEAHPDRIAVVDGDRSITYADMDRASNRLAHLLVDLGVERGDRVGLSMDKSLESVVAIYGILKSGAAYVPHDPAAPVARVASVARDSGIRHLISGREGAEWRALVQLAPDIQTLIVPNATSDEFDGAGAGVRLVSKEALDSQPDSPPGRPGIDLDLAYILYTSGSTGQPKGVMLSHLNALTFVDWSVRRFGLHGGDRLSSHAPFHFDLSVFDLFAAATAGSSVVLVPPKASIFPASLARLIARTEITVWYSVPSVLTMLVLRGGLKGGEFPNLRAVLFAGEVFPTKYLRRLVELLPHAAFFNLYGPTETNVCTCYEVTALPDDDLEPIPIGTAIDNVEVFLVADDGGVAGAGEPGELHVRGSSVMLGYWGDPDRTSRSFRPSPLGANLRDPAYMTGDLGRKDETGLLHLMGRRDSQIKSRGYRIELGEIETVIHSHPAVIECVVAAIADPVTTNRIKAYVAAQQPLHEGELARFCAERIPRYMIPDSFEFRDELPKTSTGKIDRVLLLAEAQAEPGGTS